MKKIFVVLLGVLLTACMSPRSIVMGDRIDFKIEAKDANGKPIPYVSVWQVTGPEGEYDFGPYLDIRDLRRITARYGSDEGIIAWDEIPLRKIMVMPISNENGVSHFIRDYGDAGWDRPSNLYMAFAIMKAGYEPKFVEYNLKKSERLVKINVTLTKNQTDMVSQYQHEFDSLRYVIEQRRNTPYMRNSVNNDELNEVKIKLTELAFKAHEDGEGDLAAHILYYTSNTPVIAKGRGRSAYSNSGDLDPALTALKRKAWEMNQTDPNLKLQALEAEYVSRGMSKIRIETPSLRLEFTMQSKAIILNNKERIWPHYHRQYYRNLVVTNQIEEGCQHLLWLNKFEPKFQLPAEAIKKFNVDIKALKYLGFFDDDVSYTCR